MHPLFNLIFFVPVNYTEVVKNAIFGAGGGQIGKYRKCSFQTRGSSQFQPEAGAKPFIVGTEEVTVVQEDRVEILVEGQHVELAIDALISAHPYETPGWQLLRLEPPYPTFVSFDEKPPLLTEQA